MTDLEVINAARQEVLNPLTDKVSVIYVAKDSKGKDELEQVFRRVFEDNWGAYATRIKIVQ